MNVTSDDIVCELAARLGPTIETYELVVPQVDPHDFFDRHDAVMELSLRSLT